LGAACEKQRESQNPDEKQFHQSTPQWIARAHLKLLRLAAKPRRRANSGEFANLLHCVQQFAFFAARKRRRRRGERQLRCRDFEPQLKTEKAKRSFADEEI